MREFPARKCIRTLPPAQALPGVPQSSCETEDSDEFATREIRAWLRCCRSLAIPKLRLRLPPGIEPRRKGPNGGGLLELAVQLGQKEIVRFLLSKGADANVKGYRERTPLHIAAQVDNGKELAEMLIAGGANVNARDTQGRTPLRRAKEASQHELVELLHKYGARE